MTIQFYPDDLCYVNAKLSADPGDFLKNFLNACLRADEENYEILRFSLLIFKGKYPADPERLKAEEEDA